MAKKIKFTSKKNPKPSKLARAGGGVQTSSIYYQDERIGSFCRITTKDFDFEI